ncbi:MAG: DUF3187 family protein [Candidatus Mariimomonas ferrooxydans]
MLKFFFPLVFLISFSSSAVYSFEGPLQVKNQYPIFLHVNQPYLEKALMENSLSISVSHSSTYTIRSSNDWSVNLDMEITEFNIIYKRIIKGFIEFDINVPVLYFGDGFIDGFLESYHSAFGFPDYGRSRRPQNVFLYEVRKDGNLVIKGVTGAGLGDSRLSVKKPLVLSEGFSLSIKGDLELPTGSAKKGYGNGSLDVGISVLLDKKISNSIMTYLNLGAVFPGDLKGHRAIDLENFMYGGGALEAMLGKGFSLLVQIQGQSAIYPETGIPAVDRAAYLLAFGGRYDEGKGSIAISLTEDISVSGAPDFTVNISYKLRI